MYDRELAYNYAKRWAERFNPNYYNFSKLGGDCTNFASQVVFAGCGVMNYTPVFGWYYKSLQSRAPGWTGVEYFYRFLTGNLAGVGGGAGPFAREVSLSALTEGDMIQLGRESGYYHTLTVTGFSGAEPLVCAHSLDALNRPLSSYAYLTLRCLRVVGVRTPV